MFRSSLLTFGGCLVALSCCILQGASGQDGARTYQMYDQERTSKVARVYDGILLQKLIMVSYDQCKRREAALLQQLSAPMHHS